MEAVKEFLTFLKDHLAVIGLALTWLGIAYFSIKRRLDWAKKRFLNQVNFSLNYIEDGKLNLRTLLETNANLVWLNEYGVKLVVNASNKTRADQPFILLQNDSDMGFVKRAILNVLSEHFADGALAHSLGVPVKRATFVFALTFENFADMRERKFRVLLFEEKNLQAVFGGAAEYNVDEQRHRDRFMVLRQMAQLAANPGSKVEGVDVLGRVELAIVGPC